MQNIFYIYKRGNQNSTKGALLLNQKMEVDLRNADRLEFITFPVNDDVNLSLSLKVSKRKLESEELKLSLFDKLRQESS